MKVAGGMTENDIVIGNTFDKYGSKNPIVRWMMKRFDESLSDLIAKASPKNIHEIGCGEGYWVMKWNHQGINARGTDFSSKIIDLARTNAIKESLSPDIFEQTSIYDVTVDRDSADLIVCCEVMEHLEYPDKGLKAMQEVAEKHVLLSVPREPLWRALNMMRGKYLFKLGNTPGHVNHWSSPGFVSLVSQYFDVIEIKNPFPWTMLLCRVKNKHPKKEINHG